MLGRRPLNPNGGASLEVPVDPWARRRFYLRLGAALLDHGPGAGALIDWCPGPEAPTVVMRPYVPDPALAVSVARDAAAPPVESDRPPPAGRSLGWELGAPRSSAGLPVPHAPRELADDERLFVPELRVRVRTFWAAGRGRGQMWVARRALTTLVGPRTTSDGRSLLARALVEEWERRVGRPVELVPSGVRTARRWADGGSADLPRRAWFPVALAELAATAEPALTAGPLGGGPSGGHTVVFGASGAGKTWSLAEAAARAVRARACVIAVDLHGDLGPAIAERLEPEEAARVVGVDVTAAGSPGIAALHGAEDRAAAHLVAAVKRLTPDGTDVYWGFRLERLFDAFVRIVLDSGGSLLDLYALLTDASRRDQARLSTRRPELAGFLDELAPIVRRNPEFLWPAAARLSKIALVPALADLLAPGDGGLDVERLIADGRSLVVRVPFARVGPEAASFAGSLVLARVYYGVASGTWAPPTGGLLAVVDEAQGLSPRLLSEMLGDGRKFGFALLLASQYPDRLAAELRLAAAGTVREVVAFRVPSASAAAVAPWLGVSAGVAEALLGRLPAGVAVSRLALAGELVARAPTRRPPPRGEAWERVVERTRTEFPAGARNAAVAASDTVAERVLLAILAGEERGEAVTAEGLGKAVQGLPGEPVDPAEVEDRALALERSGSFERVDGRFALTPRGEHALGLGAPTRASRETPEHRALLLRAFRLFARRGYRLEIVPQGRFDTTLPDARLRQLPDGAGRSPRATAEAIRSAERGWAWRFFGGRDVHIEAEVSGALRPERIRRGVAKALGRDAFPLFVVGDGARAARVRRVLRESGLGPDRAQVWTLPSRLDRPEHRPRARTVPEPGETP